MAAGSIVDSHREPREHKSGPEVVLELLATANSALESDRNTARACIARAAALLLNTAPTAGRILQMKNPRGQLAAWQRQRLVIHINAHLSTKMQSRELAALVNLSVSHFSRAFRGTFGVPPGEFVAKQRMLRAQQLMLKMQEPLVQIALACGLSDQPHFTRVFRKTFGMTPSAWRRLYATPDLESTGSDGASGQARRAIEAGRLWKTGADRTAKELDDA